MKVEEEEGEEQENKPESSASSTAHTPVKMERDEDVDDESWAHTLSPADLLHSAIKGAKMATPPPPLDHVKFELSQSGDDFGALGADEGLGDVHDHGSHGIDVSGVAFEVRNLIERQIVDLLNEGVFACVRLRVSTRVRLVVVTQGRGKCVRLDTVPSEGTLANLHLLER